MRGHMCRGVALTDVFLLIGGAVALVLGATALVQGGSALAKRMGISPLWVGLTVVALGTSAPELVVTVLASVRGAGDVALGNVIGSNILNILVVLGLMAFGSTVTISRVTQRRDIGVLVGVSVGVWALLADGLLHRAEGILLAVAVVPYMVHIYRAEKRGWIPAPEPPRGLEKRPAWLQVLAAVLGIGLLALGGEFMVRGGTGVATAFGVPQRVVGLTIVAIGTSAPEVATSLVALARKEADLAVGNIVGSNVLNSLLVLGVAATVHPIHVGRAFLFVDAPLMVGATLVFWTFARTGGRITRTEGAALLMLYLAYLAFLLGGPSL